MRSSPRPPARRSCSAPNASGLETEDVALANAIVTVPINPEFGSLNLAQAVILLAYEWSKRSALSQPPAKELEPPAPHGEIEGLIGQLDEALAVKGLFPPARAHPGDPQHDPHDLHQDRLVVARGQGGARHHPALVSPPRRPLTAQPSHVQRIIPLSPKG